MLIRVALLFLLFMAALAWISGWRLPGRRPRRGRRTGRFCPDCGAPLVGKGPCPCQTRGRKG